MPRYAAIWFPYLLADYACRKKPELSGFPFVLAAAERGRMAIKASNGLAAAKGIHAGMAVADCKAIFPELLVIEAEPQRAQKLLKALAEWCIGYTPFSAIDPPAGLLLEITGCAHLWGGEQLYLEHIRGRLAAYGYESRLGIADTVGAAWGVARFGSGLDIVRSGKQYEALRGLPASALRLENEAVARLKKLGLNHISDFIDMPRPVLRRRFGAGLLSRIAQALGEEIEIPEPVKPIEPYQQRLPCLEPICTATGIGIALESLLAKLCARFEKEGMGLRAAVLSAFRIDGDIQRISIGTSHASRNPVHLFRLFENKIGTLRPDLGFEMFVLEATKIEPTLQQQGAIWDTSARDDTKIAELLDRLATRTNPRNIRRYLPAEHYWPERSVKTVASLKEKPSVGWPTSLPRPVHLLPKPERIDVTAVMPDYPPMLFRYKGKLHETAKADGPERIEQEWWLEHGLFRDYYCVEDKDGARFWLFRSGPYDGDSPEWFIHGFFA